MERLQCSVLLFCFSIVTDVPYYSCIFMERVEWLEKHYSGLSCMTLI